MSIFYHLLDVLPVVELARRIGHLLNAVNFIFGNYLLYQIFLKPLKLQALRRSRPLLSFLRQHPPQKDNCRRINLLKSLQLIIRLFFLNQLHKLLQIVMLKRLHTSEHHIKNNAGTPNINFVSIRLTRKHLWRAKLHYSRIRLHHLRLRVVLPRDIEINYKHMIITLPHQQIRRLNISVHNLILM